MKLSELLNGIEYKVINDGDPEIKKLCIDSRVLSSGSLFVCQTGTKVDGHDYMNDALEQGAAAVVCEKDMNVVGVPVIIVENSKKALSRIAANFYGNPADSMNIVGITGTKGKTSCSFFVESILNQVYTEKNMTGKVGVIGTLKTRLAGESLKIYYPTATTPDTIELHQIFAKMRDEGAEYVSMEVSSHALELCKVDGIRFKVGVITNVTQDHLDFHGTMEAYAEAKSKLFTLCETAVINADDPYSNKMLAKASESGAKIIRVGIDKDSDIKAVNIQYHQNKVVYDLLIDSKPVGTVVVNMPGRFTVYNTLCSIGAGLALGIDIQTIIKGIENMKGVPGRNQIIPNELGMTVIVDYAHTPDSLLNIISSVREFTAERVICVFGAGGDKDKTKRPAMGRISGELADYCVITSDNPRTEDPEKIMADIEKGLKETSCDYIKLVDRKAAIFYAIKMARAGDTVIIAGKGHEDYQTFADRTIHFDDSEVAGEAIQEYRI